MNTKLKTITLVCRNKLGEVDYRVDKVTDSVEFQPNQVLSKNEVSGLCDAPHWKVTIVGTK